MYGCGRWAYRTNIQCSKSESSVQVHGVQGTFLDVTTDPKTEVPIRMIIKRREEVKVLMGGERLTYGTT